MDLGFFWKLLHLEAWVFNLMDPDLRCPMSTSQTIGVGALQDGVSGAKRKQVANPIVGTPEPMLCGVRIPYTIEVAFRK